MQLPLHIALPVEKQFDTFIAGENAALVHHCVNTIEQLQYEQDYGQCFLHGTKGLGKSHLFYACCHQANQLSIDNFYVNLDEIDQYSPEMLDGFRDVRLLCIDGLDNIVGKHEWQLAIFDLINQRRERNFGQVFFSATQNLAVPAHISHTLSLADLQSRLQWGMVFQVRDLSDENRRLLLLKLSEAKGIKLSDTSIQYLLSHCERSTDVLVDTFERLDRRSLQEKKALSVELIKRELSI